VLLFIMIVPLHFSWSGDGTDRIHSRGRKSECFWICKISILPKSNQNLPNKICLSLRLYPQLLQHWSNHQNN